jgi:hypothetical protein
MTQHKKMPRMSRQAQAKSPAIHLVGLSQRSQSARDRAMHAIASMRRDPKLSLSHAAKLEGVKPATIKKYLSSSLKRSKGKLRVTQSDRSSALLYVPDALGNTVPVHTFLEGPPSAQWLFA